MKMADLSAGKTYLTKHGGKVKIVHHIADPS
jgi:hypothetical protein